MVGMVWKGRGVMVPHEVKRRAAECLCDVCKTITENDLYINIPTPPSVTEGKIIVTRWASRPCKGSCGKMVLKDTRAWWVPSWGVYHLECAGKVGE